MSEQLFTCPVCDQPNFSARGLKAHVCRANPLVKGKRQRLTTEEITRAAASSTPPPIYVAERQAAAIQNARKNVHEAQSHGQVVGDSLRYLENCFLTIIPTDDDPELQKIVDRIQHLQRTLNGMELGSFLLRVNRAMEAAWGRLP